MTQLISRKRNGGISINSGEFLCISVLRVASGPRVKLASCKSALTQPHPPPPVVCSTDRSKAVVPVLVLLFVALWFILRGDLLYVFPCVILFLCFFSPFSIAITSLGEEKANLSALVRLFGLCLFRFVGSLFLLGSGERAAVCDFCTPWTFLLPFLGLSDFSELFRQTIIINHCFSQYIHNLLSVLYSMEAITYIWGMSLLNSVVRLNMKLMLH